MLSCRCRRILIKVSEASEPGVPGSNSAQVIGGACVVGFVHGVMIS